MTSSPRSPPSGSSSIGIADRALHPWLVGILDARDSDNDKIPECGGTLIGDQWVMTGAKCFSDTLGIT